MKNSCDFKGGRQASNDASSYCSGQYTFTSFFIIPSIHCKSPYIAIATYVNYSMASNNMLECRYTYKSHGFLYLASIKQWNLSGFLDESMACISSLLVTLANFKCKFDGCRLEAV